MKKIIAIILLVCMALSFAACSKKKEKEPEGAVTGFDENGKILDTVYVKMTVKDYGVIILKLDGKTAPITVTNFVTLVNDGFYNGLTFHRVMKNFMIQGGDPTGTGTGSSSKKIKGEFSANGYNNTIKHERGVISMARSSAYNSASCQFFICNATNYSVSSLDGKYAAFGRVISGIEVVDLITSNTAGYGNSNGVISNKSKQVVISEMKVISEKEALG